VLSPFACELFLRDERQAGGRCVRFDRAWIGALGLNCYGVEQLSAFPRLQRVGCVRDVHDQMTAGAKNAPALGEGACEVDVDEHVAAPDPVGGAVGDGYRLDAAGQDLDVVLKPCLCDGRLRELDVMRDRIECDCAQTVLAYESDRMAGVACARVDDELPALRS
jgi:hypothetical protein